MADEEKKEETTEKKPSIKEKAIETTHSMQKGLATADGRMWHRVLMACVIAFVGVFVIFGIFLDFMLQDQRERAAELPVVAVKENAMLPKGQYAIYQVMVDAKNIPHYLVSENYGGVVVSVIPPKNSEIPDDVLSCLLVDSSAYTIQVTDDGIWHFIPTDRYESVKQELDSVKASMNGGGAK